jgi:hypothetical protein
MEKITEEQIWEIIDGEASPETLAKHEILLKQDGAYRLEFETCSALQNQLLQLDLEVPSMRFSENVLDNVLPKTELKPDRTPLYFILSIGSLALVGSIIAIFYNNASSQNNLPINTEGVASILSNPLILNTFWIVNVLLFFIILDKKVFKPFFQKRLKKVNE